MNREKITDTAKPLATIRARRSIGILIDYL